MKTTIQILLFLGLTISAHAQEKFTIQQIQQTQSFYLNNATRALIGNGDNRTYMFISLPDHTTEWYYSFRAVKAPSSQNLNLFAQLMDALEPSGISSAVFSTITVPEGNARCNIYVTDQQGAMAFEQQQVFNHWPTAARENYTQGVVRVSDPILSSLYLCFENPNDWEGLTIYVEISALVQEIEADEITPVEGDEPVSNADVIAEGVTELINVFQQYRTEKKESAEIKEEATNYWNAGWVFYESGDFITSIDYTQMAIERMDHPALYFNLGLAQWCLDSKRESTESYLTGINLINRLDSKESAIEVLEACIQDIDNGQRKHGFYADLPPARQLLQIKLNQVIALDKWRDRY